MSHILFISDDSILKQKNLDYLIQNNYEVSTASDCLGGLLNIDSNTFDVVVLDEKISDMSCYKCCQKVRQYSNVPLVLLGTEPGTDVWPKIDELGFDMYIKKPISPKELLAQIEAFLGGRYQRGGMVSLLKENR